MLNIETPETDLTANGATVAFATGFSFVDATEVRVSVEIDGVVSDKTLDTHYTIGAGDWPNDGATITFTAGNTPPNGARVIIRRVTPTSQGEAFGDQERFRPQQAERAWDKLTRMAQEVSAETKRALTFPIGEVGADLARAADRAGKVLAFDAEGALNFGVSVPQLEGYVTTTLAARDATFEARDLTFVARDETFTARDLTLAQVAISTSNAAATAGDRVQTGLDRIQTGLDRAATEATAAEGAASLSQNLLLALAATGALLASFPSDLSAAPSPFIVPEAPGLQMYTHDGSTATAQGFVGRATFAHVSTMKAYALALGPVGTKVEAGRHRYEVVSSGEHLTTAGGVKLIVLPGPRGYEIEAFGIDLTNTTGMSAALAAADAVAVAAGQPLVGTPGTVKLNASLTHEAVVITNGIKFHFEGGVVQTFNGQFVAGREEVFVGSVGASVGPRWSSGSIDAMFPEWFGAKPYAVSGGTPFDSSPAFLKAHQAAARGTIGFTYKILCGQGIYGFASGVDVPAGGDCVVVGQGLSNTQFRAINTGAGFPDYIYKLVSSTTNTRFERLYMYGGSSSRPTKYGLYSLEMKHTHANDMLFSSFNIAGFVSAEWDNKVENCEFEFCHVGFWAKRSGGNNNDLTLDTCRFVSCEVPVVMNAGTACRVRNGQFQAALVAPFTKTFAWFQGITGFSFDNNYLETQPTGGLKGVAITGPTALTLMVSVIFNSAPYFTDEAGTVTSTLSQSSANLGTVGSVTDNLFATPAYYQAGAGSAGYTAGAVTFEAITGTGTGASGTCTVQTVGGVSGIVTSVTPGAGAAGGTKFMIGDIVRIVQGGLNGAVATVLTTGANNSIASLYMGHAGAIYPGHVRRLTVTGNSFSPSCAMLTLYNDAAICDPRKLELRQNVRLGIDYQLIGTLTDTVRINLADIIISDVVYDAAPGSGLSRRNYRPDSWAFSATPTKSAFTRNSGRYKGYPWYRLKLLPGEQVSDVLEFSIPIAASGANNSELIGRPVYLTALKNEGHANTRLRLALEMVNGDDANKVVRQNYDTGTSFTKSPGEGREHTWLTVGSAGGTLRARIQVIAASAGEQHVDFGAVILTMAGVSVDLFDVASFERPLEASASWAPGPVSAGAKAAVLTIPCLGARAGDLVEATDVTFDAGNEMDWRVARKVVANAVEIHARNVSAITLGGWTQTMRVRVHPST